MKRLLIILPVIFLMMACEDNKQNEDDINPLIGAWELTTLSVSMGNLTVDVPIGDDNNETIVIYEDGSFNNQGVLDGESFSGNGTWSSTPTTLTLIEEGETVIFNYSITGSTLTVDYSQTEEGVTYNIEATYTKQ